LGGGEKSARQTKYPGYAYERTLVKSIKGWIL